MSVEETVRAWRDRLFSRRNAYRSLFKTPGGELGPMADIVMKDLARFCYVSRSTFKVSRVTQQADPYAMALAEGRREVFNWIARQINLNPDEIERIARERSIDE